MTINWVLNKIKNKPSWYKGGLFLGNFIELAGFKSESEFQSPIAIPYAPAQGSGDGGIGSLFALNPDAKGGGANLRPGGLRRKSNLALF